MRDFHFYFKKLPKSLARSEPPIARQMFLLFGISILLLLLGQRATAAPYPAEGRQTEWVQPDGTILKLRVFGDEFYARTTTEDGFSVVNDPTTGTYYYAVLEPGGKSLVPSETMAHLPAPMGLQKNLRESPKTIQSIRDKNIEKFAPDRAKNWAAKVKAVNNERNQSLYSPGKFVADPAAAPVTGSKVGLMLVVQFPNDPATGANDPVNFPTTSSKVERFCNQVGYSDDGNTGSIRDYYADQSLSRLTLTHVVTHVITLPRPRNYYNYSNYPTNTVLSDTGWAGRTLVTDAINSLKSSGFNFSSLSVNSSNQVYSTSIFFAGDDSGQWAKGLWPHSWSLSSPLNVGTFASPRYIYDYQCTNADSSALTIGTSCHEIGHMLMNYPDLYDTWAGNGDSEGVGAHCLMGSGNHQNGGRTPAPIDLYLKDFSGWANITDLSPTQSADFTLPTTGNIGYRIRKPGFPTEYFLIENRGIGDKWAAYTPDKGLMIWHADETVDGNDNQQMTSANHYELSLEQADGDFDLERGLNRGDSSDLFDVLGTFNNGTYPDSDWWNGSFSNVSVRVMSATSTNMIVRFGEGTPTGTLSVDPATRSVPYTGETNNTFNVYCSNPWSWNKSVSWVTSSETTSQSFNQVFTYSVQANPTTVNRSTTINITSSSGLKSEFTVFQAGKPGDDHGNTIATATIAFRNTSVISNIETVGDVDVFKFTYTEQFQGAINISTTGNTDTYGYLLDASGNVLQQDDDSGDGTNFLLSRVVLPGTYYVKVHHYSPNKTGDYVLVPSLSGSGGFNVQPTIQTVPADGGQFSFSVNSSIGTWVWGESTSWLGSSEASPQSGNQTFTYTVEANLLAESRTADITLNNSGLLTKHTIIQKGYTGDDHGNELETATIVGQNSTSPGIIEKVQDEDVFMIKVVGNGILTASTTGAIDTYGYFFDSDGEELSRDDDSGSGSNFLISQEVQTGAYYVRTKHFSTSGTGNYQMVMQFIEAPPEPEIEIEDYHSISLVDGENDSFMGQIGVESETAQRIFTIFNVGDGELSGIQISKSGDNPDDFVVTGPIQTSLLPGGNTSFTVSFKTNVIGYRGCNLHVASNDLDENPFDISLWGESFGTPVQTWRQAYFGMVANAGDAAFASDGENDGSDNLLEYAFGGNPKLADGNTILPKVTRNGDFMEITFSCDSRCTDITYKVQACDSLSGPWTTIAESVGGAAVRPIDNLSTVFEPILPIRIVRVTDKAPVSAHPTRFLKVLITSP